MQHFTILDQAKPIEGVKLRRSRESRNSEKGQSHDDTRHFDSVEVVDVTFQEQTEKIPGSNFEIARDFQRKKGKMGRFENKK